ncbi:alpha/beta hydrolase [Streptomyces sp. NPDC051976]|uniref:alpha/beta fold hydrolase n=1 Tax=Streptomyces sp. NPDC051976 TaxID=3154947 RepID=UPI0034460A9A
MTNEPTLVFVPCSTGAPWTAQHLAPYSGRPVRTLRLPDGVNDMEAYADALAERVADLDTYVLVGDSFGANIALALATRGPVGLQGLVLSGGFAANPITQPVMKNALRLMGKMRGVLYRRVVLPLYVRQLASPYDAEGQIPWSVSDTHRLFLDNTPATSFDARITAVLNADYTHRLDRIKVPTLILTPSHEGLVSEDASRVMREGIPDAREVVIERAGHMFRFSHPETYGRAVLDFLDECVDGRQEACRPEHPSSEPSATSGL